MRWNLPATKWTGSISHHRRAPTDGSAAVDSYLYESTKPRRPSKEPPREQLGLDFRVGEVHEAHTTKHRHEIDVAKPIAVAVANACGSVTAETFRLEASKRGKLPAASEQRDYSWIAVMFAELCRESLLQKRRRSDGSVVKAYSKEQANDQVVYEPRAVARSAA